MSNYPFTLQCKGDGEYYKFKIIREDYNASNASIRVELTHQKKYLPMIDPTRLYLRTNI